MLAADGATPRAGAWRVGLVILRHDASKSLYVIFRGTADVKDVISDININGVTPYPDRSLGGEFPGAGGAPRQAKA
jgi:hypothetical protein